MSRLLLLALTCLAIVTSGCDSAPPEPILPEVTSANCQMTEIMKIEDEATRESFAGLCSRQSLGTGIGPTEKPLNWLELSAPQDKEETK